jgi:lactate dehydrogenase-like 2-hydroxyacid dehydrogenase
VYGTTYGPLNDSVIAPCLAAGHVVSGRSRVAVTRHDLPGDPVARLATQMDVQVWRGDRGPTEDELVALVGEAHALLAVNGDPLSAPVLRRCRSLRQVSMASVGYDSIDVATATELGITVTHTPGVLAETVADLAMGLIIAARRRLVESALWVRAGEWTQNSLWTLLGLDVHDTTLGIVGYGAIGRALARRASGFDMRVIQHDPVRRPGDDAIWRPLDELLRTADIVSLHLPLTPETRGAFGERELRLMKPTATLINTSRGGVIDEPALIRALSEGWIHSAGLDVQVIEPNPDTSHPLLSLPNCVVLPHIASATLAARSAMVHVAADAVLAFAAGERPATIVAEQRAILV